MSFMILTKTTLEIPVLPENKNCEILQQFIRKVDVVILSQNFGSQVLVFRANTVWILPKGTLILAPMSQAIFIF